MGMLGGAAKGSFTRLDLDDGTFEAYYTPLRDLIRERHLDGLDLDVEEPMTLSGVIRLIDRLRADFGKDFLITLAPVAAALLSANPQHNLSGFDYESLEVMRGRDIAWYNTQFYCGWGNMNNTTMYDAIVRRGFPSNKVVVGMVTNPGNGSGWVPFEVLEEVLLNLRVTYGSQFGGVMGWEYFNSLPGDKERPWEWSGFMTKHARGVGLVNKSSATNMPLVVPAVVAKPKEEKILISIDEDAAEEAVLPETFEYLSDSSAEE